VLGVEQFQLIGESVPLVSHHITKHHVFPPEHDTSLLFSLISDHIKNGIENSHRRNYTYDKKRKLYL